MPERKLPLAERLTTFKEVNLGLAAEQAVSEAKRCLAALDPKFPIACPAHQKAREYMAAVAERDFARALRVIYQDNPLPATTGRVCPAFCERACALRGKEPMSIRLIKRFVADSVPLSELGLKPGAPTGKAAAIVGSGPAGLTAAYYLALAGHSVTIFEADKAVGGALVQYIPSYRLPRSALEQDVTAIRSLGVEIRTGTRITDVQKLLTDFDAVFVATGAHQAIKLGVPGEGAAVPALDLLRDVNAGKRPAIGRAVAVVGGGDTAMDAARTVRRLGAAVIVFYRRGQAEMPADSSQVIDAREEGVAFEFLVAPKAVTKSGNGIRLDLVRMTLGEPDASGRPRPVPVPGSEFTRQFDSIIAAIGQAPDKQWQADLKPPIWKGGDVNGPATVVAAIAAGKRAAKEMDAWLARPSP